MFFTAIGCETPQHHDDRELHDIPHKWAVFCAFAGPKFRQRSGLPSSLRHEFSALGSYRKSNKSGTRYAPNRNKVLTETYALTDIFTTISSASFDALFSRRLARREGRLLTLESGLSLDERSLPPFRTEEMEVRLIRGQLEFERFTF